MGSRRLSDAQRERIVELREARVKVEAIAAEVGCGYSTVQWRCLVEGVDIATRALPPIPQAPAVFRRGARTIRRFCAAEDRALLAMHAEGMTDSEIGRRLERTPNTIRGSLATLARHEARAEALQDIAA